MGAAMKKEEKGKLNLEMAEALDEMDKSLSTENADFLEEVLKKLRHDVDLTPKEEKKLEALYKKHFGEDEDEDASPSDGDSDDDDPDEDDFV